ncbi:MAG: hypothetical protein R2774_14005 [Saprospiraceae bacterium]
MNFKLMILSIIFILPFIHTGCSDEEQTVTASVKITTPNNNSEYTLGTNISLKATITSNDELHGYIIEISNSDGTQVYSTDEHIHGTSFLLDSTWDSTNQSVGIYRIKVIGVINHLGDSVFDEIQIQLIE